MCWRESRIYVAIGYVGDSLASHVEGSAFVAELILIRLLIYVIISTLLYKFIRRPFRRLVETLDKEWRAATLVPLFFLITQIMILYYPTPYWYWNRDNWSRFIILTVYLLFLAVYYLLYIQASAIVEKYALEKRQLLMAQQEKLWESELDRQKSAVALAFHQRHDMHHHNAVIMGLIQSGDMDKLRTYMISFDEGLDAHHADTFCLNPIANSILNFYANKAEIENIKTEFQVSIPENIGIDNINLTCVLGNVLENAVEGCLRLSKDYSKEISVTIKYFDHRLRIKVVNTCLSEITFDGDLPLTQKTSGGTGTKSILYTAEYYDGTAGFSVTEGRFITQIVLNGN